MRQELLRARASRAETAFDLRILFEDESLIAVDKPPGLPMHATADAARDDFYTLVRRALARRDGREAYLGLHQRLDRDTSGVVLFTRAPQANAPLAAAFARHEVVKTYEALVHAGPRRPPAAWRAQGQLGTVGHGRRQRVGHVTTGGQEAETDFRLLAALDGAWHVEAVPRTGRKHQIRAQLADAGWPILGDARYAPERTLVVARVMLHARRLELRHPQNGHALRIESPLAEDFASVLRRLRAAR